MRIERSDTFGDRPAWRVTSFYFCWGPYCYSRTATIWQWFVCILPDIPGFLAMPFIRAVRWVDHACLVCGRSIIVHENLHHRYCSLECMAYDGALKDFKKSWVLYGRLTEPKRHHEADMKGDE